MRRPTYRRTPFGLNMTPMIDIVFQLLIFFVCTVEFQREDALEARLPLLAHGSGAAAKSEEEADLGRIDVKITANRLEAHRRSGQAPAVPNPNHEFADELSEQGMSNLMPRLRDWIRPQPKIPVYIECDKKVPTGTMLQVYDTCRRAGPTVIQLVEPAESTERR